MINGIHHTAIATHDIERLIAFYCDVVGFELVLRSGWEVGNTPLDNLVGLKESSAKVAMLSAGNTFLELFEYASPRGEKQPGDRPVCDPGLTHIGLNVTDIDAEFERLSRNGMRFHSPPIGDRGTVRAAYGRDPDGNVVELLELFTAGHPFYLAKAPKPQFDDQRSVPA